MSNLPLIITVASAKRGARRLMRERFDALFTLDDRELLRLPTSRLPPISLVLRVHDVTPQRKPDKGLADGNQMLELIRFARRLPAGSRVLVNCTRGRSRSTAAAIVMYAAAGATDAESVGAVFAAAPRSNPNGWMLKLADAIIGTRLFKACSDDGYRVKW